MNERHITAEEFCNLVKEIENSKHIAESSVEEEFEKNGKSLDHEYMRGRMCAFEDVLAKLKKMMC